MDIGRENLAIAEELYRKYCDDPDSVGPQWLAYFRSLESDGAANAGRLSSDPGADRSVELSGAVRELVQAYRRFGHLAADLDPLGLRLPDRSALELRLYGLQQADLERKFERALYGLERATLAQILQKLERTYSARIGVEYEHIRSNEERLWLAERMEVTENSQALPLAVRLRLYEKLFQAEHFEKFLAMKFVGKKRFSLEGAESLIPALDACIEDAGAHDVEGLVIGMAHRGRLNVLVNILEKPAGVIFAEFKESYNPDQIDYADVKYHLGYSFTRTTLAGKEVHLSLAFNPSHLEAVDPVVLGSVRARQTFLGDLERSRIVPLMIHGDASFIGQGVVAECLNLWRLPGYSVGGTIHLVVNNQIGFTTAPSDSRSTEYCTDLARGFQIPVFHVNGDDPEAVYRAVTLACEFRHRFHRDVIIDLFCYRRLGHNENDEPAFTQPLMYDQIRQRPTTVQIYRSKLAGDDDVAAEDLEFIENGSRSGLEASFQRAQDKGVRMQVDTMGGRWAEFATEPLDSEPQTRLLAEQMERSVRALVQLPPGFQPHPKIARLLETRAAMSRGESPIDWGFAELLAFGSILENGYAIRLAGQDARRGTFSHRHATLVDIHSGQQYTPLQHISAHQGAFEVLNSPLSEYACLGFEYGYSLADPRTLVLWEAQFGDFVNGAQIMLDQFIASSEVKWRRMSGIVLLLPHGYEGQGPEHSSARPERLLQMCSRENMQVCNCTTPAQYFHLLRRQMLRRHRKPLILLSPKSLLRLPAASSTLQDLALGVFREVLHDRPMVGRGSLRRLIFCSGKVYYDLLSERQRLGVDDVALVRLEQLYPYPYDEMTEALRAHSPTREYMWLQEEPLNQGAWFFIRDRLSAQLPAGAELLAVARDANPSPAAGLHKIHELELAAILKRAFAPATAGQAGRHE
ncbi:MAG: 2-oxoglutarate dehydrogenase E1 component [Leptospirales bacterium]|nr:2-oxoglutarate dehydrogenase E1 component [Leptospirales bacterium]